MGDFNFDPGILEYVREPVRSTRINQFSDSFILNLVVSSTADIYQAEYLTVLLRSNLLVTILREGNTVLQDLEEEVNTNLFNYELNLYHLFYYMVNEVLYRGMDNLAIARNRVNLLSQKIDEEYDDVPFSDIIISKREINQLSNIVEDQYAMLGFLPKVDWSGKANEVRKDFMEMVSGYGWLQNSMERLEEKLNSIQAQYQLILQDKGNRRLNTLTIIQAIFVPLTLIAGIYGMNFIIMPELNWKYGYFMVWGIMGFVAIMILLWFKLKGWFD